MKNNNPANSPFKNNGCTEVTKVAAINADKPLPKENNIAFFLSAFFNRRCNIPEKEAAIAPANRDILIAK